jgi:CHASE2 domain-containing sensor protein
MTDTDFHEQMILDAMMILRSEYFIEKEIFKTFSKIDEASNNNYTEDFPILTKQLQALLKKIKVEDNNMSAFMLKYRKKACLK